MRHVGQANVNGNFKKENWLLSHIDRLETCPFTIVYIARPSAIIFVFLFLPPPPPTPPRVTIIFQPEMLCLIMCSTLPDSLDCLRMIKTTSWGEPDVYFCDLLIKNLALFLCVILY